MTQTSVINAIITQKHVKRRNRTRAPRNCTCNAQWRALGAPEPNKQTTNKQTNNQTNTQTDKQTSKQANKRTNKPQNTQNKRVRPVVDCRAASLDNNHNSDDNSGS